MLTEYKAYTWLIIMPYEGELSDNSYKFSNRSTRPFVELWMKKLSEEVKKARIPLFKEFEISVYGRFLDERRPDMQNLFKVIGDGIKKGLGVDDKHFRFKDIGYEVGHIFPQLLIYIRGIENE